MCMHYGAVAREYDIIFPLLDVSNYFFITCQISLSFVPYIRCISADKTEGCLHESISTNSLASLVTAVTIA